MSEPVTQQASSSLYDRLRGLDARMRDPNEDKKEVEEEMETFLRSLSPEEQTQLIAEIGKQRQVREINALKTDQAIADTREQTRSAIYSLFGYPVGAAEAMLNVGVDLLGITIEMVIKTIGVVANSVRRGVAGVIAENSNHSTAA
jgi:hypothetical protein